MAFRIDWLLWSINERLAGRPGLDVQELDAEAIVRDWLAMNVNEQRRERARKRLPDLEE